MEFGGRKFELTRAGDVRRDGMGLLADEILPDGTETTVLEAFWRDSDGKVTFTAFERELPFELVEIFVANVRSALTPSARSEGAESESTGADRGQTPSRFLRPCGNLGNMVFRSEFEPE